MNTALKLATTRLPVTIDSTTLVEELEHNQNWADDNKELELRDISAFVKRHTLAGRVIVADHSRPHFITYAAYDPEVK